VSDARPQQRFFVSYSFYKVAPEWRRLPCEQRQRQKAELVERLDGFDSEVQIRSYTTMGMRADADFLLWKVSPRLEPLQQLATTVAASELGAYLSTPHNYLAMTRRSSYVDKHSHPGQEGRRTTVNPTGAKYFFVYPFVKTHGWYQLPFAERQRMMDEHIKVGHEFPSVKINTTYSFGLDDQEFVVGFETDSPGDFLDLVMKLREAEQRPYTERDTPIFTCIAMPLPEVLEALG
jgi:chlorite dismutase